MSKIVKVGLIVLVSMVGVKIVKRLKLTKIRKTTKDLVLGEAVNGAIMFDRPNGNPCDVLIENELVEVLKTDEDWCYINKRNHQGWVRKIDLDLIK